uniref:Glutathione transferase n=1 Tax=Chlamydomonas leiostraca TaxID=1034604 RepID=A0A7S0S2J9_9CHLO
MAGQAQEGLPRLQMFDDAHSLYCAKVRVALIAKGAAYESLEVPCGSTNSPQYLAQVPLGKLPALLVTEPGQPTVCLMESEVINEYLEERFPAPAESSGAAPVRLMPSDQVQRAQVRMVSRFHDLYFAPALAKLYPHVDPAKRDPAAVAAAVKELQARTEQLLALLPPRGPYACGSHLTLADCGYPAAFLYIDLIVPAVMSGQGMQWPERIKGWQAALGADPHVQAAMDVLKPGAYKWMRSKLGEDWQPPM